MDLIEDMVGKDFLGFVLGKEDIFDISNDVDFILEFMVFIIMKKYDEDF